MTTDLIDQFTSLGRGWVRPDGTLFPVRWHSELRAEDNNGKPVDGYAGHGDGWLRIWTITRRGVGVNGTDPREIGWEAKTTLTAAQTVMLVTAAQHTNATEVVAYDPAGDITLQAPTGRDLAYKILARCQTPT